MVAGEAGGMNTTNHHQIQHDDQECQQHSESLSTAPLGAATGGQLVFTSVAIGVTILGDPALVELYRARFVQHVPSIHLEQEPADERPPTGARPCKVTIHYRHRRPADRLTLWREPLAAIALNGSIPWEIEFHSGVANLQADLRGLRLRSLDLSDSSEVKVLLPQPTGNVYLYVSGSASDVVIQRPVGVALCVQIAGSASQVRIDGQPIGAITNGINWQTPNYHAASDRYDIRFASSVSNVMISGA
jgi:hypothetical protein